MKLEGEQFINATREQVFAALNDPEILKECIPGCEELNKDSDTEMNAKVSLKVGPVRAKFAGSVTLSNLNPPESYSITGEGKGGAAGFAKGGADVTLKEQDGGTLLVYNVKADLGGKIAQLGARLMDSTAKKLAGQFFAKFGELVETVEGTNQVEETAGEADVEIAPAHIAAQAAAEAAPTQTKPSFMPIYVLAGISIVTIMWLIAG